MMVRLNFIKDVLHLFTYCFSTRILLFISRFIYLVFQAILLKK